MMDHSRESARIEIVAPDTRGAAEILRSYIEDVASTYYGRAATVEEIDAALLDDPSDDLVPPRGIFMVARQGEVALGCAGLRLLPDGVGEVCRVFVAPHARHRGLGALLMGEIEEVARAHARSVLRLDTRHDLVEARRLYCALGYDEVPAFNEDRYAEHWFMKSLAPARTQYRPNSPAKTSARNAPRPPPIDAHSGKAEDIGQVRARHTQSLAEGVTARIGIERISSLGFRTDLMLLSLQGSSVEDHDDYVVIRSPHNSDFWWGNFLLFRHPPTVGGSRDWEQAFAREFPEASHRTFGVDGTCGDIAGYNVFSAAGYDVSASAVMTATAVHAPPRPNCDAKYRKLDLDDDHDRESAIGLRMANGSASDPQSYRRFLDHAMESMAALQRAGAGSWFGAFVDGQMVSGMGLFSDCSGVARFQSVDTHPEARGRGLAGTLVHHVSTYGLTTLGATTLVMVADPDYPAIRIYRSVGFERTETQIELERAPGGTSPAPEMPDSAT